MSALTLYADLPREGPGDASDVARVCAVAAVARVGAVCNAACASGADLVASRDAVPEGRRSGIDRHLPVVSAAVGRGKGAHLAQGLLIEDGLGLPDPETRSFRGDRDDGFGDEAELDAQIEAVGWRITGRSRGAPAAWYACCYTGMRKRCDPPDGGAAPDLAEAIDTEVAAYRRSSDRVGSGLRVVRPA